MKTVTEYNYKETSFSSCIKIKEDGIYLPLPMCVSRYETKVFLVKIATPEQIVEIYEKFIKPHEEVTNG